MKNFLLSTLLFLGIALNAQEPSIILSGPMLGYTEMRETFVWVQFKEEVEAKMLYWPKGGTDTSVTSIKLSINENGNVLHFKAINLTPGTEYEYLFEVNEKNVLPPHNKSFKTQELWQHRTDPPNFKIALGSCTYINEPEFDRPGKPYGGEYQIFESIANKQPDMMLWLGDNTYLREADWNSWSGILHRYTHTRQTEEMQRLLSVCNHYAIWDDHEFGPNDADGSFTHKDLTLNAFKLFWGNNGYGINGKPGITGKFSYNDADFFLLDNRYYRTPNFKVQPKHILGEEQVKWLIEALKFSKATFKFVAVGGQFLNSAAVFENHAVFAEEREKLLQLIKAENIKGVVFLTGDRHHSELSFYQDENLKIYDLTVSPLTSGTSTINNEQNEFRVEGSLIKQRNFGLIEILGPANDRAMAITYFDSNGMAIWGKEIKASDF